MLFIGTISPTATREELISGWDFRNYRNRDLCLAVINRKEKYIVVRENTIFSWELTNLLSKDYTIFYTNNPIENPNLLLTGNTIEANKLYGKYLITNFIQDYCYQFYKVLANKTKFLHKDVDSVFKYDKQLVGLRRSAIYTTIKDFVINYSIDFTIWYDKDIVGTPIPIIIDTNYHKINSILVKAPTLKDIIECRVFTDEELEKLNQAYFYTKYCYGKNIPFKDVIKYWDSINDYHFIDNVWKENGIYYKYFDKLYKKLGFNYKFYDKNHCIDWKDEVKRFSTWLDATAQKEFENNINRSNENYKVALKELQKDINIYIDAWRCNKPYAIGDYKYNIFIPINYKKCIGRWIVTKLCHSDIYSTIKFKYVADSKKVITSGYMIFDLEDIVCLYKLYKEFSRNDNPKIGTEIEHNLNHKQIIINKYKLNFINYCQKRTEKNILLDDWDYVIKLSYMNFWLSDIEDFIAYYNLYKEFGINK